MAGMVGTAYLVQVNTGTEATPIWTTVGAQRDTTVDESVATIDVSSKDSAATSILPGRYNVTISFDHLYVPGQAEHTTLANAIKNRTSVQVREFINGTPSTVHKGYLTSRSSTFPDMGEAVVSVEFQASAA